MAECRYCGKRIYWAIDTEGKAVPLEKLNIYAVVDPQDFDLDNIPQGFTHDSKTLTKARQKRSMICTLMPYGIYMANHWAVCEKREVAREELKDREHIKEIL